jgi:dTDP-4-amino-4,6-dideoxygalactose transaminase
MQTWRARGLNDSSTKPIRELAVLGGKPAFPEFLHVGRPNIGNRQKLMQRLEDMLDSRWLTNLGPMVRDFEARLCEFLGVKHCIAMCNATVGLEIAIRAAGLKGEVIVPSFTFIATAHALQWQEITPVFCEVDPATHNIDPSCVEALITPATTGIIGVHLWGRPCAIEPLEAIATQHNLALMFDAAHAFGSQYKGRRIGQFGLAEVFSFHATKVMNAFEGGAVATNDDEMARKIRLMNNFGFTAMDRVDYVGTNGKMSEASAAMGLTSLESLGDFIDTNMVNHGAYRACLAGLLGLELVFYPEDEYNPHQYVVVEVDPATCPLTRDELIAVLHADNIRARRYFYPGCHRMEPYRSRVRVNADLTGTEALSERVLCLPTGTAVGPSEIAVIGEVIAIALDKAAAVKARLAGEDS